MHDFLEQVRLRPGMWLPGGSLRHLQAMLVGYRVALGVHSVDEPFDFWSDGPFSQWLGQQLGCSSSLGWAAGIERATPEGATPVDEFFRLLDRYRRETVQQPAHSTGMNEDLSLRLMSDTFVTLFWRRSLLEETTEWLREHGYRIVPLAAGNWSAEDSLHHDIAAALGFPDYYGHNLDALNDCLRDVACHGGYTDTPEGAGLVLVFNDYDQFAAKHSETAQTVLDIIAGQARQAAVLGRRVICLVHSNDPGIRFEPVGAMPVMWNDAEWLDSSRRPA
ncbi:barstar family protein [Streptomyces sp. NPDC001262]|uniref:barstar family protein n=1 Tax=Streptomyces sp. NPDC001262 TaxID=3364552 RepID=UPI0036864A68